MRKLAHIQSAISRVNRDNKAATLSLEMVLFIILVLVVVAGIWFVVTKYIIGDANDEDIGFIEGTGMLIGELFQ